MSMAPATDLFNGRTPRWHEQAHAISRCGAGVLRASVGVVCAGLGALRRRRSQAWVQTWAQASSQIHQQSAQFMGQVHGHHVVGGQFMVMPMG